MFNETRTFEQMTRDFSHTEDPRSSQPPKSDDNRVSWNERNYRVRIEGLRNRPASVQPRAREGFLKRILSRLLDEPLRIGRS